ncbi:PIR protein [Plasmodium ovale]|uniref:PIR Superfamily Protein n=2 Tax=Plasmodium ovale TaxID=36330 RepID=A0A1A8X824_PLAOA|nr:PIR Superfamily Protein [Plasmodium ovale curtisi]SBT83739.1 PIR protein [Plasmodium ovale]
MATDITVNELPSKQFNSIWNEGICYNEVTDIITNNKIPSETYRWMDNFRKVFKVNLEKHQVNIKDNSLEKRCRDLYYIIYDILYKLKNLKEYTHEIYNPIKLGIKRFIDSAFIGIQNGSCLSFSINEVDYENVNIMNKKYIDDLGEDITYIEKKMNEVNRSIECNALKKYLEGEIIRIKSIYETDPENYKKILQYYKQDNFDHFENIIGKIKCTSGNAQETALMENKDVSVNFLPLHIFIVPFLSIFGFLLIIFFIYKVTPFRYWFDRKIRKNIKFSDSINDEITDKFLIESPRYIQTNSYATGYNVL